eukprot:symbB.v1.2.001004.t1/scaffold43.1/size391093/33
MQFSMLTRMVESVSLEASQRNKEVEKKQKKTPKLTGTKERLEHEGAELIIAALDASTRCVFQRHAARLGVQKVTEVERLDDLIKVILAAQHRNCSIPLLVFVGEARWETAIANLETYVRPVFMVRSSATARIGPCHRQMLPSGSFNTFINIVSDCEAWWEEACKTGTWYRAAPLDVA